ncbi:MAG: hypothetical protein PHP54_05420 [Clostridia bacterium]|nr:hypothetical protein [Clostridia bacterium]
MKKFFIVLAIIVVIVLAVFLVLHFKGQKDNESLMEEIKGIEKVLASDLKVEEEKIETKLTGVTEVAKEDIDEAISYIQTHVEEPIKDSEVAKKMYYYASYLEEVAKKDTKAVEHEIGKVGTSVKSYIKNIVEKTETVSVEVSKKFKKEIKELSTKITNEKDKLVGEFHQLVTKK